VYVDHDSDDSIATVNAPLLAVTLSAASFLALLARGSFSFVADLTTLPLGRDAIVRRGRKGELKVEQKPAKLTLLRRFTS
jgi:hypothetical protein